MEGTESFVNEQLQRFGDTIRGRLGWAAKELLRVQQELLWV